MNNSNPSSFSHGITQDETKRDAKEAYDDFNTYVGIIRKSVISRSYYHDLFASITIALESENSSTQVLKKEANIDIDESEEYIDPFQGMPEASAVILEIINEIRAS